MVVFFDRLVEKWRRSETFFDAIWSGQCFTDRLGLSILTYDGNSRIPRVKKVPLGLIVTVIGQLVILYFNIVTNVTENNSSSFIIRYGMRWISVMATLMILLVTALNAVFRHRTFNLMQAFCEFDSNLKAIGYEIDLKVQNDWCNLIICISGVLLVVITSVTFCLVFKASIGVVSFLKTFMTICWTNYVISVSTGQYVIYNYSFQYRFKVLNKYLCNLLPTDAEHTNQFRLREIRQIRSELMARIGQIAQLHSELVTRVLRFSDDYTVQLMQIYFGLIVMTIFSCFTLYRVWVNPESDSVYIAIINFCWTSYYTTYLLFNIFLADMVQTEAKKIGISAHKAINLVDDDEIGDELLLLSNQIYQRTPVVSCKLFNFDASLIFSVIMPIVKRYIDLFCPECMMR